MCCPATSWPASAAPSGTPAANVGMGTDHTLFATTEGHVEFATKRNGRIYISVKPAAEKLAAE